MAVVIDSGPVTATDQLRNVPQEKWRSLMLARRYFMETGLSYDCKCLVQFVEDAKEMYGPLGFASAHDMVRDGYGLQPEEIEVAVAWLRLNPDDHDLPLEQVVKLGRQGQFGQGRPKNRDSQTTSIGRGNDYVIARLERDGFSDLAQKVRRSEISGRAAAIKAGFRRKLSPFERVVRLWPKLSLTERQKVRE